jgi:hypothetical protein
VSLAKRFTGCERKTRARHGRMWRN